MKKRIAIIDSLGAYGSSHHFYLFGHISAITDSIKVNLYTNNNTELPKIDNLYCYKFYKDIFTSRYKIISLLRWIKGTVMSVIHARMSSIKIFHFHVFNINAMLLFQLLLVKLFFSRSVLTIHDVLPFSKKSSSSALMRSVYRLTNVICTHNNFSKNEIKKLNHKLKVNITPHGNYLPFINIKTDILESRKYLGIPKNKNIILFFGMIKEEKGLDILLKSFKKVLKKNPETLLLIAGKPYKNDFSAYKDIILNNDLSNNCILHIRFIPAEDVSHYYCASDLVVLPYKKVYQSGVLMMALSYKKPVLVSDLIPFKEIITNNKTGFFFNSEDTDSLSTQINRILLDTKYLKNISNNGYNLVKERYDWRDVGVILKDIYFTIF